jgi:hypothetical protein
MDSGYNSADIEVQPHTGGRCYSTPACKPMTLKQKRIAFTIAITLCLSISASPYFLHWSTKLSIIPIYEEDRVGDTIVSLNNGSVLCPGPYFKLSPLIRLSVCRVEESTVLDIRLFLAGKATIKGIAITTNEWQSLVRAIPLIEREIILSNH